MESSTPVNVTHRYVGIFQNEQMLAVGLLQQIDLNQLSTFGVRDHGLKIMLRDFLFKNFAGKLLILGNNMLTGQHAIAFATESKSNEVISYLKSQVMPEFEGQHIHILKEEYLNFVLG